MFEKEIQTAKQQLSSHLLTGDNYVYLHEVMSKPEVPGFYKTFFSSEVDWWIYEQRMLREVNPRFDFADREFGTILSEFDRQCHRTARFDHAELTSLIDLAVKTRVNYLLRPRTTLKWFIYRGEPTKPLREVLLRFAYFDCYSYLTNEFTRWANSKLAESSQQDILSVIEFERLIENIDNEIILEHTTSEFTQLLAPLYDFFNEVQPAARHDVIPTPALIIFLDDKGILRISQELERLMKESDLDVVSRDQFLRVIDDVITQVEDETQPEYVDATTIPLDFDHSTARKGEATQQPAEAADTAASKDREEEKVISEIETSAEPVAPVLQEVQENEEVVSVVENHEAEESAEPVQETPETEQKPEDQPVSTAQEAEDQPVSVQSDVDVHDIAEAAQEEVEEKPEDTESAQEESEGESIIDAEPEVEDDVAESVPEEVAEESEDAAPVQEKPEEEQSIPDAEPEEENAIPSFHLGSAFFREPEQAEDESAEEESESDNIDVVPAEEAAGLSRALAELSIASVALREEPEPAVGEERIEVPVPPVEEVYVEATAPPVEVVDLAADTGDENSAVTDQKDADTVDDAEFTIVEAEAEEVELPAVDIPDEEPVALLEEEFAEPVIPVESEAETVAETEHSDIAAQEPEPMADPAAFYVPDEQSTDFPTSFSSEPAANEPASDMYFPGANNVKQPVETVSRGEQYISGASSVPEPTGANSSAGAVAPAGPARRRIEELLDDSLKQRVLKHVFHRNEGRFHSVIERLNATHSWRDASAIIDRVFSEHEVDPYSSIAKKFSDIVYERFSAG